MRRDTSNGIVSIKIQFTLGSSLTELVIYLSQCCTTEMR